MYHVRSAVSADTKKIMALYQKVAIKSGGIARSPDEVTQQYVEHCMREAASTGIQFVIDDPNEQGAIVAEIHGYKMEPKVFVHVISELTIAVDPDHQGKGIGKTIFSAFLEHISTSRRDILRVELVSQESNTRALRLYQSLGFMPEGKMTKRIRMYNQQLDADIPMAWFNKNFAAE